MIRSPQFSRWLVSIVSGLVVIIIFILIAIMIANRETPATQETTAIVEATPATMIDASGAGAELNRDLLEFTNNLDTLDRVDVSADTEPSI